MKIKTSKLEGAALDWAVAFGVAVWFKVTDINEAGIQTGDTPLVAAMRCYVGSKLGDEVDVPEELL